MSVYRLSRNGHEKLTAEDLEASWDAPSSRYRASGRVAGTRSVRRCVEEGWPVSGAMKAACLDAVAEVLGDPLAGAREKVAATMAVVAMTRINASIDAADAGRGDDPAPMTIRVEYVDVAPDHPPEASFGPKTDPGHDN
jgi:hypothetical protein